MRKTRNIKLFFFLGKIVCFCQGSYSSKLRPGSPGGGSGLSGGSHVTSAAAAAAVAAAASSLSGGLTAR